MAIIKGGIYVPPAINTDDFATKDDLTNLVTKDELDTALSSIVTTYSKTYVYYVTGDGKHAGYDIKHPFGADVNVSVYLTRQSIFGETMDELVMVDVYTKPKKVKLVFSSAPSSDMKFKVVITGVELKNVVTFEEESWANIRKIVLTGNASKYWDIGDTKSITSKSGKTYKIRLADLQDGRFVYSAANRK